ncbi:MAG: sodium:proton antiporter [Verrucomicrobia bacterium]|nr:sodium:proton antiporter [Verrucomicrobiota bacterium]
MGYEPNPWMILPFGMLLLAIALAPLVSPRWWGRHYSKVALVLGAVTLGYYLFGLPAGAQHKALHTGQEYVSFIALIGALYVVSGGIHIRVKGQATPAVNTVFLLVGAILANVLGTTGASMLMIRPWLRMNKYRITAHHVVFFIFLVSNVGGCLTPIGDPPLFLGYLRGVPFWWVARACWPMWATAVGLLLAIFYALDRHNFTRAPKAVREAQAVPPDTWRFEGLGNLGFLAVVLAAVFVEHPVMVREVIMVAAAAGSYLTTRRAVHEANAFDFHPIREVAVLFMGIFATMMPALDWLELNAGTLASPTPGFFYWSTGVLSSVLDNAPTYLTFLSASLGAFVPAELVQALAAHVKAHGGDLAGLAGLQAEALRQAMEVLHTYRPAALAAHAITQNQGQVALLLGNPSSGIILAAISVSAVFFGASTYIGNGPNFMVKSIAEQQHAHVPGFLGYVLKFTLVYLLPVLAAVWLLFFH